MAQTLRRAMAAHSFFISKRLLSTTTTTITSPSPLPSILFSRSSVAPLSHAVQSLSPLTTTRFSQIRCSVDRAENIAFSTLKSGFKSSERPSSRMGPLFPGTDFEHWLIVMEKPGGENVTKKQMIDCYVRTLAQVLGSEEEAKKKIYNVSFDRYFGFGCEIDEATSNKLEGLPGVLFVVPDSYVDAENKDYGAELFVNGEIVERSPERQMRVGPRNRFRGNVR